MHVLGLSRGCHCHDGSVLVGQLEMGYAALKLWMSKVFSLRTAVATRICKYELMPAKVIYSEICALQTRLWKSARGALLENVFSFFSQKEVSRNRKNRNKVGSRKNVLMDV